MLVIALAPVVALCWAGSYLSDARATAAGALMDRDKCRLAAAHIEDLNKNPGAKRSGPLDETGLQTRGQAALQQMGISLDHLVQIAPDVPRTVGKAYKEVPSHVVLRDLSLRQLVGFLLSMTGEHSALLVRSLRLYAPHDTESGAQWTAEVTLSYLIYEPPPPVNLAGAGEKE